MYTLTHTTPPLIINPTMEDIAEYKLIAENPLNEDYLDNKFKFSELDEIDASTALNLETFNAKPKSKPKSTTKSKYLIGNRKIPYPPVGTIETPTRAYYKPELEETNYHNLTPEQIGYGQEIIRFFTDKGLSRAQAAGIAGNLFAESSFNPSAYNKKGKSFGLAQWLGPRLKNLKAFAKSSGKSEHDFKTQLDFIWKELNTTEKNAYNDLLLHDSSHEAARSFADKFERMKEYNSLRHEIANYLHSYL